MLSSRRRHYLARVGIFLIAAALIAATVGGTCGVPTPPGEDLEIRDWYDLAAVKDNLGGNYTLINDLDSTTAGYEELASPIANQGKGWQPIGTKDGPFIGTFDGQGYEIRDLLSNRPDEEYVGLFGSFGDGGVIKDIGVVDATVAGNDYVGGLVGVNDGTVSNSYSSGSVTGNSSVGGLLGVSVGYGIVSNSYSTASVTGDMNVGGLVGWNEGYAFVSNSYSTGNVTGGDGVGGLVGANVFDAPVRDSYSTGNVTGDDYVGGLVGLHDGTVSNSYSTASVTGYSYVGGLLGANVGYGTVSDSYSTGSVTGNSSVGGLLGLNYDGTVSNSYSTGSVSGNSSVGGLVGQNDDGTVSNSFWDTETSGQATSAGGTGNTTAEMQDIASFSGAGWNIIAVANPGTRNPSYTWNIVHGVTYPFLSWQL